MSVFVIPSWYPTRTNPLSGAFFSEQIEAILTHRNDASLFVSACNYLSASVKKPTTLSSTAAEIIHDRKFNGLRDYRPHKQLIVSQSTLPRWSDRIFDGGYSLARRKVLKDFALGQSLGLKFDAIIAFSSDPGGVIGLDLKNETGLPLLVIEHMGPFPIRAWTDHSGNIKPRIRRVWRESDVIAAVSSDLAKKLSRWTSLDVQILHNPISDPFREAAEHLTSRPYEKASRKNILAVSRLVPGKGFEELIEAFSMLSDKKVLLEVVGSGPLERKLKALCRQLGVEERVIWSGTQARTRVAEKMLSSSLLVMASHSETFSLVCAEALACGLPVLATRSGGPEDIVDEKVGLLVEPKSSQAILEGLEIMLGSLGQYSSSELAKYSLERFGPDKFVSSLESLLGC